MKSTQSVQKKSKSITQSSTSPTIKNACPAFPRKLRAIIFDLDNTLYEYMPCHNNGLKWAHKKFSQHTTISFAQFGKKYKTSMESIDKRLHATAASHNRLLIFQLMLEKMAVSGAQRFDTTLALELESAYWQGFFLKMRLDTGVDALLSFAKKHHLKLGLITDLTAQIQFAKLSWFGFETLFDAIVTSEEVGIEKPNRRGFDLLIQKLNVKASECVLIGDNPIADCMGAWNAGIYSILIARNDMQQAFFAKKICAQRFATFPSILRLLVSQARK